MGQDFIIAQLTIPVTELTTNEFKDYQKKMVEYVKTLTDEEISIILENSGKHLDIEESVKDVISEASGGFSELKRNTIKLLEGIDIDKSREVTYIEHKEDRIYLAGGMSWGDDPTNAYSDILFLSEINWIMTKENKTYVNY